MDGIILEADGSDEEQELIQEASDADIPVVTVLTDDSSSARISFVGLNSYQLGNAYTEQILGLLKEHENTQGPSFVKFPVQDTGDQSDLLPD